MHGKAFFDTNVLVYAIAENDPRTRKAEELLAAGGIVSVQVLNEFASVARRKLRMPWNVVLEALDSVRVLCPSPVPLTIGTHEAALRITERYGYGISDALIAAAALDGKCTTLYSEDFQDGMVIHDRLIIRNPFR